LFAKGEKEKNILFASIRLMICVGHADGYIGNKELSRIQELVNAEHFTLKERQILMDDMDYPKQPEVIVQDLIDLTLEEKLMIMRMLYRMALIDRKLSDLENEEIHRIAGLLGISPEKRRQVEEWIKEGLEWRERWNEIIAE